jgi:hypothetical protein
MENKDQAEAFMIASACPNGQKYTLVLSSLTKRLLAEEMPAAYRMQFLEHLEKMGTREPWITAEMIAAIEPMCDKGYEIVQEAQKLGANKALDAYAKFFSTFAMLNPSLIAALQQSPSRSA